MKILVISGCSSKQKHRNLPNKLGPTDFRSSDRLDRRMQELSEYKEPAAEMYEGPNHTLLMEGLRNIRGKATVDWYIISTGYGLISASDMIAPYDVEPKDAVWKRIPNYVYRKASGIIRNYDLVFFLLGKDVQALQFRQHSFPISDMVNWIFVLAPSHYNKLPSDLPPNRVVEAGDDLAYNIPGPNRYNLRGFIFKKLCETVHSEGFQVFEQVKRNPQRMIDIVHGQ